MNANSNLRLPILALWLACLTATADDNSEFLIDGRVVDSVTGESIKSFTVLPGVPFSRSGDEAKVAVWQPHLIREMKEGELKWHRQRGYKRMRFRVEADGYRPAMTPWTGNQQPQFNLKIHMQPDAGIEGVVINPDGTPADQATLAVALPNSTVRLLGYEIQGAGEAPPKRLSDRWRIPRMIHTDAEGRFRIATEIDPAAMLCVSHRNGFLELPFEHLVDHDREHEGVKLKLQRWARIEGEVYWKDRPGVGEVVNALVHRDNLYPGMIEAYPKAESDAEGRYKIEYLPPGRVQVAHNVKLPTGTKLSDVAARYEYPVFQLTLTAGETVRVDVGGKGMVVTGKLSGLSSYDGITISIAPPMPDVWRRFGNDGGGNDLIKGFDAFRTSDHGKLYWRRDLPVAADGTFRIEHVMTGKYDLTVERATGSASFTAASFMKSPIDIGTIPIKPMPPPESPADVAVPN